jgi:hypothetical protein
MEGLFIFDEGDVTLLLDLSFPIEDLLDPLFFQIHTLLGVIRPCVLLRLNLALTFTYLFLEMVNLLELETQLRRDTIELLLEKGLSLKLGLQVPGGLPVSVAGLRKTFFVMGL